MSTGFLNAVVVPAGRSPKLPIESSGFGFSFNSTFCSLASGVYLSASVGFSVTVTLTVTSSLEPSGYVTTTVPSFSPAVVVSTGVFHVNVVFSGKSSTLAIPALASGSLPTGVVIAWPSGVFLSASDLSTVTFTVTVSVDPSGYVTVTGTSYSPGVLPSGNLLGSSTVTFGCSPSVG